MNKKKLINWITRKTTISAITIMAASVMALWDGEINVAATADKIALVIQMLVTLWNTTNLHEEKSK